MRQFAVNRNYGAEAAAPKKKGKVALYVGSKLRSTVRQLRSVPSTIDWCVTDAISQIGKKDHALARAAYKIVAKSSATAV